MGHQDLTRAMGQGEGLGVIRKKILLRLLARCEAERLKLAVPLEEVQTLIDEFRIQHGLVTTEEMTKWLGTRGLGAEAFVRTMYDLALVSKIEQIYDRDIKDEIQSHMIINSKYCNNIYFNLKIVDLSNSGRWIQINVAIERREGGVRPGVRALFERLIPALVEWRRQGIVEQFFFMRKPPDLRLRFLVPDRGGEVQSELGEILSGLERNGVVEHSFPSVYEPEVFLFGGPEAMELVHAYFDADSMAWIALDRLTASGRRSTTDEVLVLSVMNDLFLQTLRCASEVWDVWCNLGSLVPATVEEYSPEAEAPLIDVILPRVNEEEAGVLENYRLANRKLSIGLRQIWADGKLQCGLRAIFPFMAMFQFNRHGLDGPRQGAVAGAMRQAWDPRRNLRAGEAGAASSGGKEQT